MTDVHSSAARSPVRSAPGGEGAHPVHMRVMRGLDHFSRFAGRIEQVGDGEYLVPSGSRPDQKHRVRLDVLATNGEQIDTCECSDYQFAGHKHGLCKHTVSTMLFQIKSGSLGFAREHADYWIEYRTGIRSPEAYCPRDGYVYCYATESRAGRRYITEILPNGNYRHYWEYRHRREDESQTLIGMYRTEREALDALHSLALRRRERKVA